MPHALLLGIWLGFSIAAPVGPIGLLVLNRSLENGVRAGLATGLGAALADLVFGIFAACGVYFSASFARPFAAVGAVVLLALAWRTWSQSPTQTSAPTGNASSALSLTASTFVLTISNPMTILSFAALIATTGAASPAWFVGGVFCGSMLWWTLLSSGAALLSERVRAKQAWIARTSAVTLAAFALRAAWKALFY